MRRIDVEHIMLTQGISKNEMASLLYPLHREPMLALRRLRRGESTLDEKQMNRLAARLHCLPADLFGWKMRSMMDEIEFTKGDRYVVRFNTKSFVASIIDTKTAAFDVFIANKSITLDEFMRQIDILCK